MEYCIRQNGQNLVPTQNYMKISDEKVLENWENAYLKVQM